MVEFSKVLTQDQLRVLELEFEIGETEAEIADLKLQIEDLEEIIKAIYGQT